MKLQDYIIEAEGLSKSTYRRLLLQNAIRLNGYPLDLSDLDRELRDRDEISVGSVCYVYTEMKP